MSGWRRKRKKEGARGRGGEEARERQSEGRRGERATAQSSGLRAERVES